VSTFQIPKRVPCLIELLALMSLLAAVATARAQPVRPRVVVQVTTRNLPDEFRPADSKAASRIHQELEAEAVKNLRGPFPLFNWIPNQDVKRPAKPEATLTIDLAREQGVIWRVYLACSFKLGEGTSSPLSIPQVSLNAGDDSYPYPDEIEAYLVRRGKQAVATLIESGNVPKWRREFIPKVPLSNDLLPAANKRSFLVIPLLEEELQAGPNTLIEADLVTKIPGRLAEENVFFKLLPGGPVHGTEFNGMQECVVKTFRFGGKVFNEWVPDVPIAVAKDAKVKVTVRAAEYIKRDSPISTDPDS
jgi:hypothetical protein